MSKEEKKSTVPTRRESASKGASAEEIDEMREVFAWIDKDGSGSVTAAELSVVLRSVNKNYSESELKAIINKLDANGDGEISFEEFYTMMKSAPVSGGDELKQAFSVFDKDGGGTISAKELKLIMDILGEKVDKETLDLMFESVDLDKSGEIDFNEFKQMMKDGPQC